MSVAASVSTSPSARSRIPAEHLDGPRVETARETTPSLRDELVPGNVSFIRP